MSTAPTINAPFWLGPQIEARAEHPEVASRVFLRKDGRTWTFRQYRNESVRVAHLLQRRLGAIDDARPGHVAMVLENHPELLFLYGGCGYAGLTLFGVNTGLRGETLSGVLNQSRARVAVVDQRFQDEFEKIRGDLRHIAPENVVYVRTGDGELAGPDLMECATAEVGADGEKLAPPSVDVKPEQPIVVIYTSGTTGLPKGIVNNHAKMLLIGMAVSQNLQLGPEDVGYACMPLFHSNSLYLCYQPALQVCGSFAIRERFSASKFVPDVFDHGVTFWNYVGEPVHYVLVALEKQFGGDVDRIHREITNDPRNKLRYALGNGAAAPDIERFTDWLGLEDMFELYGSTEAAISTFRKKGDPRGSVGEVTDPAVKILNERGDECPNADIGPDGKIRNYADAVGEICRVAADTGLFQGYFDNPGANTSKYRDGVYHSGDLGHIVEREGKRFLFFDGRTDDWIRKDGENFSALQVARLVQEHPDVVLAAAYGVPCSVSDELVMVALKIRPGASFDPKAFFEFCDDQVVNGGMDKKWFPDFVRLVDEFEYTQTEKILVRNLKRVHFDRKRLPSEPIYFRTRGDKAFRPLGAADYAALRDEFAKAEKLDLLDR
ncbi:MAG TPA: AMP-binding protein [Candidatus Binatia bacterium]|nr:AMP-binding protein [Candidatus Binatia bacterium]